MPKVTLVKALGIIAIVIGHIDSYKLSGLLYLYSIPLFFFVSGYLFNDKYSYDFGQFVRRRLNTLYLPYVAYCVAFILLRNLFVYLGIYGNTPDANSYMPVITTAQGLLSPLWLTFTFQYLEPLLTTFWFIQCLFCAILIFAIVRYTVTYIDQDAKDYLTFLGVVLIVAGGFYASYKNVRLPLFLDVALVEVAFVFLGFLYRKHEHRITLSPMMAITALAALYGCSLFGSVDAYGRVYKNPPFYIFCGLAGIYFNFWLAERLSTNQNWFTEIMSLVGNNSYAIMALHFLAFKAVTAVGVFLSNGDISYLSAVVPEEGFPMYRIWYYAYIAVGVLLPIGFMEAGKAFLGKFRMLKATTKEA